MSILVRAGGIEPPRILSTASLVLRVYRFAMLAISTTLCSASRRHSAALRSRHARDMYNFVFCVPAALRFAA